MSDDKPYLLDGHMYQYDLGWMIHQIVQFKNDLDTAIDLKTIHYADPINWDITTQYAPNTVVVDPKSGTAYMSKRAVPVGILLDNTDYWVVIFNYQRIYDKIMDGVAFNDRDNIVASKDLLVNDMVWFGGDLYRCTRPISQGSKYIPGTNLTPITIADSLATYYGRDRVAQVLNDTINVSGDYTVNAGDVTETADNVTLHATTDTLIDTDGNRTDDTAGTHTVIADTLAIQTTTPMRYQTPTKIRGGNYITLATPSGDAYYIPTGVQHDQMTAIVPELYGILEQDVTDDMTAGQGMTVDNNYVYIGYRSEDDTKQIIYKVSRSTGVVTSKQFTQLGHINGMTNMDNTLIVTSWTNDTGSIYLLDKSTLTVTNTLPGKYTSVAIDHITRKLYGFWGGAIYEIDLTNGNATFVCTLSYPNAEYVNQGMAIRDGIIYRPVSENAGIFVFDLEGNFLQTIQIPNIGNTLITGELEDCDFVGTTLFIGSYQSLPYAYTTHLTYIIANMDIFTGAHPYNKYVRNHFNLTCDATFTGFYSGGEAEAPFRTISMAGQCATVRQAVFGIQSHVLVKDTGEYPAFELRGNAIKNLTPSSGHIRCKQANFYGYSGYIKYLYVCGDAGNHAINFSECPGVTIEGAGCKKDAFNDIIYAEYSNVIIRNMYLADSHYTESETASNLIARGKKSVYSYGSVVNCYRDLGALGILNTFISFFPAGITIAKNITTSGLVTFNNIDNSTNIPNLTNSFQRIGFVVNGVLYMTTGSCTIPIGSGSLAVEYSKAVGTISVTLTGISKIDEIIGFN